MKQQSNFLLAFTTILILIFTITSCQNNASSSKSMAEDGLKTLQGILTASPHPGLLSDSTVDVHKLILGESFPVYYIKLEDILSDDSTHTQNIIRDAKRVIYPILSSDSTIVSSEELQYNEIASKWEIRRFGETSVARNFYRVLPNAKSNFLISPYLLRIPCLSLDFFGGTSDNPHNVKGSTQLINLRPTTVADSIFPNAQNSLRDVIHFIKPLAAKLNGAND